MSTARFVPFVPESPDGKDAVERYRNLYRAAGRTVDFGASVRLGGVVVAGILVILATLAYQLARASHAGFPGPALALIGCAILAVLLPHLWDRAFRARGQALLAAIDAVVYFSPYISGLHRVDTMSLRRRSAERETARKQAA